MWDTIVQSTMHLSLCISFHLPFDEFVSCISCLEQKGLKRNKQTNKQKSHTHTKCFGCGIMFHYFLTTLLCLWNFYFRKILTILAANYIAGSIIPITLQYCIRRILAQLYYRTSSDIIDISVSFGIQCVICVPYYQAKKGAKLLHILALSTCYVLIGSLAIYFEWLSYTSSFCSIKFHS